MKLAEYRAEIGRQIDSNDAWRARENLRNLSLEIRRIAWNPLFHREAMELARLADREASEIELRTPGMMRTDREPRWDRICQGGCWSGPFA